MGLFDTVRCEFPLPDPSHQELEFQTKDLDCLMDEYLITREGRLLRRGRLGSRGLSRNIEWPFDREVRIYKLDPENDREFIEYVVRFTDGRVEWIRRLDREPVGAPPPAEPRLKPEKWGRALTLDEYHSHSPEKLELLYGDIPGADGLLLLLLTNLGLQRAARLVDPEEWRNALEGDES